MEGKKRLGKDAEGSLRTQRSTGKRFHYVNGNQLFVTYLFFFRLLE